MSHSYKFKIIMGGVSDLESIPFFENSDFNSEDFSHIGITINPIECMTNSGDSYLFVLWHLNQKQQFEFMISSFCHGARGGLICIDRSRKTSYIEAKNWIEIFKNEIKNIPLILLSFQSKNNYEEISRTQVERLFNEFCLNGHYTISPNEKINYILKKDFFKFLIERLNSSNLENSDFSIIFPTEEKNFIAFSKDYQICPLCKKKNHIENLKDFYFSKNEEIMYLREKFFELNDKFGNLEKRWVNSLNLGIVCCSCYKKLFE